MISDFIIGLDISTSSTGIALLDVNEQIIDLCVHKPKGNSLVEKGVDFQNSLQDILLKNNLSTPKAIYIEQNLQRFRRGFSSAKVINTLARYNGMCSLVVYQLFTMQPEYIPVNHGRKVVGIKIKRGENTKEKVFSWAKENYDFEWPTKVLKSGPRKNLEIFDNCCYDISDALVTAIAGIRTQNGT